jgi:hypothetical protein
LPAFKKTADKISETPSQQKMAPHGGMDTVFRTRDIVALGAALVAFFFATQSSPDTSLKLKWYIELDSQSNVSFLYKTTFT